MSKNKLHYLCVEIDAMARYIGLDLWGCSADQKSLRVAPTGSPQPTGIMSREEIRTKFLAKFEVLRHKPYSSYLEVQPRAFVGSRGGVEA
jgi:hypothetical protein